MANAETLGRASTRATLEIKGAVATIWLDRPAAGNAIDAAMAAELRRTAFDVESAHEVRAVLIRGRGPHFSVGGDIRMFSDRGDHIDRYIKDVIADFHDAAAALQRMEKPTIAVVHGAAAGGGLSLALACDYLYCATDAKLATAYSRLGVPADGGMTHHLSRLLGPRRALQLMLQEAPISGADAVRIGLADEASAPEELESAALSLASRLAALAPAAVAAVKRLLYAAPTASFQEQLNRELQAFSDCAGTADFREGLEAFRERRRPRFGAG